MSLATIRRLACAAILLSAPLRAPIAVSAAKDPSLEEILREVGAYVLQLEQGFSTVVSDESYTQTERRPSSRVIDRTLGSETFFLWVPENQMWLTFRDVHMVNGNDVGSSRERIDLALRGNAAKNMSQLQRLREEGVRFNLGGIYRTFNDPMFALQVADPRQQRRFAFKLDGQEPIEGIPAWRITWVENEHPTLIGSDKSDLPTTGTLWVSRADHVVLKTELRVDDRQNGTKATIAVVYRQEPTLNLWIPARMDERYDQDKMKHGTGAASSGERIECTARYSNFRRFETTGRLSTQ